MTAKPSARSLTFAPLTPDRWADCEWLFGPHGACAGCWCMWWRLPHQEFKRMKGEERRLAFRGVVDSGEIPGIIAYEHGQPVGWCSVAPRDAFPAEVARPSPTRRIMRRELGRR
ncbi:MAG: hypothetical protein ACYC6I_12315 [Bacillota bacterium]